MSTGTKASTARLLGEICRLFATLLTITRRLATNFTPSLLESTLRERASLLCLIESKRNELEGIAAPESYTDFEQCRTIHNYRAAIGVLDRTISMLIAVHMERIKNELASLPVSFRAVRSYLRHSRISCR